MKIKLDDAIRLNWLMSCRVHQFVPPPAPDCSICKSLAASDLIQRSSVRGVMSPAASSLPRLLLLPPPPHPDNDSPPPGTRRFEALPAAGPAPAVKPRRPSREGSGGVLWVCVTLALVGVAFALGLWSGRKVPVGTCQPEPRREREESSTAVRRIARPEVEWGGKSVHEEARAQLAVLRARHGNGG